MDIRKRHITVSTPKGIKVKPLRIIQIRSVAEKAREILELKDPYVDVVDLYEFKLAEFGVVYDWCEKDELDNQHGLTFPNDGIIKIRQDVYDGACAGKGRDRFTMGHEMGHLFLHDNVPAFARSDTPHKWIEDSEWQADTFAAEFLMPIEHIKANCRNIRDVMELFGVTSEAANNRWRKLVEQGLI